MEYNDKYGVAFSDDRKTLLRCPEDFDGEYIIPEGVEYIGRESFGPYFYGRDYNLYDGPGEPQSPCVHLTSVKIPDTVKSIGNGAFCGCIGLTSIKLPNNVKDIGEKAFSGCTGLPIFDNIRYADSYLIEVVDKTLSTYHIKEGTKFIGSDAFYGCNNLTSITIPNSVTSIGMYAFMGCSNLTSINIPDSVKIIEYAAFGGCTGLPIFDNIRYADSYLIEAVDKTLSTYHIKEGTKNIGGIAFYGCKNLTAISIPNSVTSIGDGAFFDCSSLTSISIPNSITNIGNGAFEGCSGLTSVTIPNSVTSIGEEAFSYCTGLTSVTIPKSVTSIGDYAFLDCTGLTSVIIPNSVTNIGKGAFSRCTGLTSIMVPLGQEEHFCQMEGLKEYADIIRKTSEKRRQHEDEEQRRLQEQQMQEMLQGSTLFFDTETTGTPRNYKAPVTDSSNWPRLVQLAWIITDKNGNVVKKKSVIIKPDGFSIPSDASAIHGITTERALREGKPLKEVLDEFTTDLSFASQIVGHNIDFDQHIVGAELYRLNMDYSALMYKNSICTMQSSVNFCAIPNPYSSYGGYKWPSLSELYWKLFRHSFDDAHDALADITATKDCYYELKRKGII